ncbi:hypothetical protein [Prosthecobacter sp.]|uniref:hypothetical protein n=1 Tax=Prosthecobacter sp. TaxID=1965333 RepID=UPI003784AFDA
MLSRHLPHPEPTEEGGWRASPVDRHHLCYEEYRDGQWQRLEIEGEMLAGPPFFIIHFSSIEAWKRHPAWAHHRRDEIIDRIKSRFPPPAHDYEGEAILSAADRSPLIAAAGGLSDKPCRWASCTSPALHGKQFCVTHCYPSSLWRQPSP